VGVKVKGGGGGKKKKVSVGEGTATADLVSEGKKTPYDLISSSDRQTS